MLTPSIRLPRTRLATILTAILGCNAAAHADTVVTVCSDDLVPGTLRSAVASAADGAVIDISGCSKITLAHGEIATSHTITIKGPATGRQTVIDADYDSRVLRGTSGDARLTLAGVTLEHGNVFTNGTPAYGGCIDAQGEVELQRSIVTNCAAVSGFSYATGGAVNAGKLTLRNSRIAYGQAKSYAEPAAFGGGAAVRNGFYCYSSTIHGNGAFRYGGSAAGGGIESYDGPTVLEGCTVDANFSADYDGAIAHFGGTWPFLVRNSTISGNSAPRGNGGIYAVGPLTIVNSTIVHNRSSAGPCAGVNAVDATNVESSIIARNVDDGSGCGDVQSVQTPTGANNIISKVGSDLPRGWLVADPQLTPLAFRGGPTQTHGLSINSSALDLGSNGDNLDFDQRGTGFARVVGGRADIGAYERQPGDEELFYGGFE
jgi:hypothetical protein